MSQLWQYDGTHYHCTGCDESWPAITEYWPCQCEGVEIPEQALETDKFYFVLPPELREHESELNQLMALDGQAVRAQLALDAIRLQRDPGYKQQAEVRAKVFRALLDHTKPLKEDEQIERYEALVNRLEGGLA